MAMKEEKTKIFHKKRTRGVVFLKRSTGLVSLFHLLRGEKSRHAKRFPWVFILWGILALHKYKSTNTFTVSGQLQPCFLPFLGTHLHHSLKRKMLKRKTKKKRQVESHAQVRYHLPTQHRALWYIGFLIERRAWPTNCHSLPALVDQNWVMRGDEKRLAACTLV